jgi:hypothetical protein
VVLCEKYVADDVHNLKLLPRFARYLSVEGGKVGPRPEFMTLLQGDIRDVRPGIDDRQLCDFVVSTSVYEHLDDVDGITCALAALTVPEGQHIHFVDLRDHFFKYPFEMLTFSQTT